ncbi:MAG: hypothetical protein ABSF95_19930 [Verrucomicrobiota bacterium]|jgi:cysteine sulfinate desulfinase/cysteine desulfurase-like protein
MVYFDHNATAPMMPEARQAWLQAGEQFIGNPSSPAKKAVPSPPFGV